MEINKIIKCKISGVLDYGVFVKCDDYTGLIHISEMSDAFINDLGVYADLGDNIVAKILEIDEAKKRLKLSYKQANPINPKILKHVKIKIGFHSLGNALPYWIKKSK